MKRILYILLAVTIAGIGGSLTYTPTPFPIDLNANGDGSTNIQVKIKPNVARPYYTTLEFVPHKWLMDNSFSAKKNGRTNAILHYEGGGGWAGSGNTGLVVETNASYDRNNKRIDW